MPKKSKISLRHFRISEQPRLGVHSNSNLPLLHLISEFTRASSQDVYEFSYTYIPQHFNFQDLHRRKKKEGEKKKKIGREMATTGSLSPPPPLSTLSTQSYQGGLLPLMKQHGLNSWEWRRTTDFSRTC